MKTTDDEAVSLAEITDLAWAFVKDRFPQREARARLATALAALMGGSYRQLGSGEEPRSQPLGAAPHPLAVPRPDAPEPEGFRVRMLSMEVHHDPVEDRRHGRILPGASTTPPLAQHDTSHWDVSPPHPQLLSVSVERRDPAEMTDAQREEQARNFAAGNVGLENPRVTRESVDRAAARMEVEDRRHGQILPGASNATPHGISHLDMLEHLDNAQPFGLSEGPRVQVFSAEQLAGGMGPAGEAEDRRP